MTHPHLNITPAALKDAHQTETVRLTCERQKQGIRKTWMKVEGGKVRMTAAISQSRDWSPFIFFSREFESEEFSLNVVAARTVHMWQESVFTLLCLMFL